MSSTQSKYSKTIRNTTAIMFMVLVHTASGQLEMRVDSKLLQGLEWRGIGPTQFGGRVTDIAGVPGNPNILYVAHASAGLFKSINGGTTFESIFEDGNTLSIGAIALAPNNPDIIYVGTGEGDPRNSISFGDGIYKSNNGGKTWNHLGLKNSEHFSTIIVHPFKPHIVFAAVMGHAWGPNKERGVFRSTDGGDSWEKVLYVNETTGASDISFDPEDPDIIYAGMYDHLRQPWHFRSGGPGSGLYRSIDGGKSWVHLTDSKRANGLPKDTLGRIGISVSRSNPHFVYAIIESKVGVLWRSTDRGINWELVNTNHQINRRPFYFSDIRVDPADENRVYSLSGPLYISNDGGKSFKPVSYWKVFGDHHALWIDPNNPNRLLNGNDGGFFISNDRGKNFNFINNLPFAQAYHVGVDMADPYNVLGGFQDHEIWRGPNERWNISGVRGGHWIRLRYMADGMYAIADPRDPNIIFFNGHFGDITRIDMRIGEERYIQPYPVGPTGLGAESELYRFNWNSPIHMSPSNPDIIYYGGNVLFKTTNAGNSWEIISPDLTTNNPSKMKISGGSISLDNTRAEYHCTILSISESPYNPNVILVGTDDGNVQLTLDGGISWTNLTPNISSFPKDSWVSSVRMSSHSPSTAYISVDQHRLDDFNSYIFVTTNYGKTWQNIADELKGYVHVVTEDPRSPELLYAGTELGIFASFDGGQNWTDLRLGLPPLPVRDLVVHPRDNDLIIATHARGFYILDDITPLQKLAHVYNDPVALFKPMQATRYTPAADVSTLGDQVFVAPNEPYGALISYYLSNVLPDNASVSLSINDSSGRVIRKTEGPGSAGVNRVVWDLREEFSIGTSQHQISGMRVLPGTYTVNLIVGKQTLQETFKVRLDPRINVNSKDLEAYKNAVRNLLQMQYMMKDAQNQIDQIETQMSKILEIPTDNAIRAKIKVLRKELAKIKHTFSSPRHNPQLPNLLQRVEWLIRQVSLYTGRPTKAQQEYIDLFERQTKIALSELDDIIYGPLVNLNLRLEKEGIKKIKTRIN